MKNARGLVRLGAVAAVGLGLAGLPRAGFCDVTNPGFESGVLSPWTSTGSVFLTGTALVAPAEGTHQALINKQAGTATTTVTAPFMGVTPENLAAVIGDGDLNDLSESVSSAI